MSYFSLSLSLSLRDKSATRRPTLSRVAVSFFHGASRHNAISRVSALRLYTKEQNDANRAGREGGRGGGFGNNEEEKKKGGAKREPSAAYNAITRGE